MSFFANSFALAGLALAIAPVLIHLLNRRRFRIVEWAAMDFLREALQRQRRLLRLRDILLLAIRVAAVLLFGFAMARPYLSRSGGELVPDQPIHAIVVVDNSLSSSHQSLSGTVLDEAKKKAADFIRELPAGSRATVLPACGGAASFSLDAHATTADALESLESIRPVDRVGYAPDSIDLAYEASLRLPELSTKRVVLVGDQQLVNWPTESLAKQLESLPEMQVVQVGPRTRDNAWIEDFRVQDDIADTETPTVFVGTIRFEGVEPRSKVPVRLAVDGVDVATREVDLVPGQAREVEFRHTFDVPRGAESSGYARAALSVGADDLPMDDQRVLVVPVLSSLPVVFIDQLGSDEDPSKNLYGETIRLRRLIAPVTRREERDRQLVRVRHVSVDEVDQMLLADARLVVVAGVESPGGMADLLREYVEQGGQLVIACGGAFDPEAWTRDAWRGGRGVLPAPLEPAALGDLPDLGSDELQPLLLDVETMVQDYFRLDVESPERLRDFFHEPLFFKVVVPRLGDDVLEELFENEKQRLEEERRRLESGEDTDPQASGPDWLTWRRRTSSIGAEFSVEDEAERSRPRALGRYGNGVPFLVERRIGAGQSLLVTTGVYSNWSNLTKTPAVFLFDRIFRTLLRRTLRIVNHETSATIEVPIDSADRRAGFRLRRPDGEEEQLAVEARGSDRYAVMVRGADDRGHYTVTAHRQEESATGALGGTLWELPLAVNGPAEESSPAVIDSIVLEDRLGDGAYLWVSADESIRLEGALVDRLDIWKYLMLAVLLLLLLELLVLAWSRRSTSAPEGAGALAGSATGGGRR